MATTDLESLVDHIIEPAEETPEEQPIEEMESEEAEYEDEYEEVEETYEASEDDAEDYEDTSESEESSKPETYTVKVDGNEVEVTIEDLKRGYSGQQYVQQGMREAAESKKQANQLRAQMAERAQNLDALFGAIQSGHYIPPPTPPSDDLIESDPIRHMTERAEYEKQLAQYSNQVEKIRRTVAEQQQANQIAQQEHVRDEMRLLVAMEPDFLEPEKARKLRDDIVKTGVEVYGYAQEDIGSISDHRAFRVLIDAMRYRQLIQSKNETVKNTKRKVAKKGQRKRVNTKQKSQQKKRARFEKTGRIEDALDLITKI